MISIFGIRHHGPGSARSLRAALAQMAPDLVLVEGPPDANAQIPLASAEGLTPPVALLLYDPDHPRHAVYYPFAAFSPEWQALQFALVGEIPVRFMDLAQAHRLGAARSEGASDAQDSEDKPFDPFALVAEAAGFADGERWWESFVEQRQQLGDVFESILLLMAALREDAARARAEDALTLQREAAMRTIIRQAQAEGFERIAVVCGAWHAPALRALDDTAGDAALLADLPEVKVDAAWVPWTYDRLSRRSGYGAGIDSPGWYHHLWFTADSLVERWMVKVAQLLREEDLSVSPAHAIEATRLAETLAALRGFPAPGLAELTEAARAVFCFDVDSPLRLIREQLIISQRMGEIPPDMPQVPLAQDLAARQRSLRFKPSATPEVIDLDLRGPILLGRSKLLHRLNLLDIPWGTLKEGRRGRGTFHEVWEVEWQPEFAVRVIEASLWGNTVAEAAENRTRALAVGAKTLPELTALVEAALLADLGAVIPDLVARLQHAAATSHDITHLMDALPPLANVLRYGDVRKTGVEMMEDIVKQLVARICIGLPPACFSLDDAAAGGMFSRIDQTDETLAMLRQVVTLDDWYRALKTLAGDDRVHGLVRGRACLVLFEQPDMAEPVAQWMSRALSPGTPPNHAAAWLEGFLTGSGQVLVHHPHLWEMLDAWVMRIPETVFVNDLPLLRRTFSSFTDPVRQKLGERARRGPKTAQPTSSQAVDEDRAKTAASMVNLILKGK